MARIVGGIAQHHENQIWIIVNGAITLLLGLLIIAGWPWP